jgi:hypothetical protein
VLDGSCVGRRLPLVVHFPDSAGDSAASAMQAAQVRGSNDCHVIALATIANVRILCTDDVSLMSDFKDKRLLDRPCGEIRTCET